MLTDLEIARAATLHPIQSIAQKLNIPLDELELYGKFKAKLPLHLINSDKLNTCKLILVSAITPTPAGEGKTTNSIGLTDGLNRIGKRATAVLREPSLGPVFGIKGGATGGGKAQVVPMEDINLHFTGDFSAIEKAHNLLAAIIDNNLQNKKNKLGLEARSIRWKRVMDMNDRSLRKILVGLGGTAQGIPRETGFDITAASEVMAILCLSRSFADLKQRLGNIFVGMTTEKKPVFARDLKAHGAMAALLKDAVKPNLVQTLEGNPAILHCGPFANIAQGTNTIFATKMGMSLSEYVVTEAGFGFDLGGEKFLDIKCGYAGISPSAVVIVATVRALKYHGGGDLKELKTPNPKAVENGLANLEKHLENVKKFGLEPIVAINKFYTDTPEELSLIKERCAALGVNVSLSEVWEKGGEGAVELATFVAEAAEKKRGKHQPLYDWAAPVEEKIKTIAREIYGASGVEFQSKAKSDLKLIESIGLQALPICIAKTQKSLSDNPDLLGRPTGFTLSIREIEIAAGAGFLVPIAGEMMRMPGLPETPASEMIDIDDEGNITGLF
ncbi:MAG: formate--tetrahydrofolate ligase [Chloroherpetonaceae bacterium]|nr:formate--tetrahydrofolate ligase [Chloroherpetonaceae bacterium]